MTKKEQQCYDKAMIAFENAYIALCNASGPLQSLREQLKVIEILQEAKSKINELIKRK